MKKPQRNNTIPLKIQRFFKLIYLKLFRINDSPQRIALGLGIGIAAGILPGTGPIAALFLAFILRVNRAAALLGSLLTNTWLSLVTFVLSIKIGSVIMQMDWNDVYARWTTLIKDFHLKDIFQVSVIKIILPIAVGYMVIALTLGSIGYASALLILLQKRRRHENTS